MLGGEGRLVSFLPGMEAQVFEEQDVTRIQPLDGIGHAWPDAVISHRDGPTEQVTRDRWTTPVRDAFGFDLTNCSPLSTKRTRCSRMPEMLRPPSGATGAGPAR